ncbi:zinc alcohol dehydrogenase [Trichoderma arundinaceum]|uniref:Zinc alcohol dehydrogenase n=1 Tax=Trichoderma arundinaceum TaxID=490622 RepID=A0A395N858_TRIAR|nr:zinc alcohol dehydrogenase [Trichoderma arundinaceum]
MATTSRAWTFSNRGSPSDVLSLTSSRPIPTFPPETSRSEEWILVKVAFAGLNVGAIFQMSLIPAFLRNRTCIPEMDLSGIVQEVWHPHAENSSSNEGGTTTSGSTESNTQTRFRKGDGIMAMLPASHALPTGTGALAEYVAIPARFAVHKPPSASFGDSAGCLLTGMTAHQQVAESGAKPGDRVLINAASGGIGTMAVQMARQVVGPEGHIVGICSSRNVQLVESLGADEVVDYTQHANLPAYLAQSFGANPFDAIIDTLGHQSLYVNSPSYLVPSGTYSSVGIKPPDFSIPNFLRAVWQMKLNEWWPVSRWLGGVGRLWRGVSMMEPTLEDRERIAGMLGRGEIRVVRDSVWQFGDVKEAYAKLGGLHASGKVLVRVDETVGDDVC